MGVRSIITCRHQVLVIVKHDFFSLLCATLRYSSLVWATLHYSALLCTILSNSGVPRVTIGYPGLFWGTHNLLYLGLLFSSLRTSTLRISDTF
jgi:hypothetical protein